MAVSPKTLSHAHALTGDTPADRWLRKQFNWGNVEDLIREGKLLTLTYDFEANDLNTTSAAPTQFAGKITTLDGRVIDEIELHIQVPEDKSIAAAAALVTRSDPEALYRVTGRIPPHIAAGRITRFFRSPYRRLWDLLQDHAITVTSASGREEEVRVYTITSPDGSKHADIRLHQGGKILSVSYPDEHMPDSSVTYRDADGTRWKRIAAPAITEGHNIRRYDDRLLWNFLHRSMCEKIFLTHTKEFRRFRVDTLDLAKLSVLLDPSGQNGFRPGVKIDPKTGKHYRAFTLTSLMEANTRDPNPEIGLDEGVRMPDGSKYDRNRAHASAAYDVEATIALKAYIRKRLPALVRLIEKHADFDRVKPFLIMGEDFKPHPVMAFARNVYPLDARLHFGVCVNINEEVEERRQAVMIRTDTDQSLADYTFNGEKLLNMTVDQLTAMLEKQRGQPEALCEVVDLRKNPPLVPADMAFDRGLGGDPEKQEKNRNFIIEHEDFCHRLMEAHTRAMPPMPDYTTIRNPRPEEHLFTAIAAPKRYEFEDDGKKVLLTEKVHTEWIRALGQNRRIDATLRRAIEPQDIESENRADSLAEFIERMKAVDKTLNKYLGFNHAATASEIQSEMSDFGGDKPATGKRRKTTYQFLPSPDKSFTPPNWDIVRDPNNENKKIKVPHHMTQEECTQLTANAVEYLWKLRAELMYEFHDNSTHFTVQDRYGHNVPFPALNKMRQSDLANYLRIGEYTIHMEELNVSSPLIAKMFRDAGRIPWVKQYMARQGRVDDVQTWEAWESIFAAERALAFHGEPNVDVDKQRWITSAKGLRDVERIQANLGVDGLRAQEDQWGLWEVFVRDNPEAERILAQCARLYRKQMEKNPLTKEALEATGYDPKTGQPFEHAIYEVPPGAKMLTIDVPDKMLEAPLSHPYVAHKILMLNPDAAVREILLKAEPGTYVVLRGAKTGRKYLAAKPVVLPDEAISANMYYQPIYEQAAVRYLDSDMPVPPIKDFLPLAVEALEPVPGRVNHTAQTLKISRSDDFVATVSPALGHVSDRRTPLTGLIFHDFVPIVGVARLQSMLKDSPKHVPTESGWEIPVQVNKVRTLTLAQARQWISTGIRQMEVAIGFGKNSIESLRTALDEGSIQEESAKNAGFKSLNALHKFMNEKSLTPQEAIHYGFASLADMRSSLTTMFTSQEIEISRDDNKIHLVDIDPPDKMNMTWYRPALRNKVHIPDDVIDITPTQSPDPTRIFGGPHIERGKPSFQART